MDGKKHHKAGLIRSLIMFVVESFEQISDLIHLAALEAKLAVKTLVMIAVLLFVLSSVLTASWISILVAIFLGLIAFHVGYVTASLIIVAINILTLAGIFYVIAKIKTNLYFPSTVSQLTDSGKRTSRLTHARIASKN